MRFYSQRGAWVSKSGQRAIAQLNQDTVNRITVIRHAALGDMLLTRPFLIEIRRFFPNAEITLSVVSHYQNGIPNDLIDHLHVIYGSDQRGVSKWRQILKMRELAPQDIIFDVAATPRSKMLCFLSSAKIKIGFPYKVTQRWLYTAVILRTAFKFEAEIMLDMLHLIGHVTEYPPRFDLPGEAIHKDRRYIIYFTGSSKPEKCWPSERFSQLVKILATQYPDIDHVLIEGRAKWESIDPMLNTLSHLKNVEGLKGLDLESMTAHVKGAVMLVSNDTGIRHIAIASGIPTLGIFFDDYPFRYWPRYGIHEIAFNPVASIPSVESLHETVDKMLHKILKN